MTEVMDPYVVGQTRLLHGWSPDAPPEPASRDMPVGVPGPQAARVVLAVGPALGAIAAVSVAAVVTATAA